MKNTVFASVESADTARFELPEKALVGHLLEMMKSSGIDISDLLVFREDGEEPLEKSHPIDGGKHPIFHAHRCRKVEVSVHYAADTFDHKFAPSVTIATVKAWAVKKAKLGPAEAEEHILQVSGTREQPPLNAHLGKFATNKCAVEFDLVRKKLVQG
jgi:hypothetical protein